MLTTKRQRLVCWYSRGVASAVAAKLAIQRNAQRENPLDVVVANIFLENEYPEPELHGAVGKWLGVPMTYLRDKKYGAKVENVIASTRYMAGPSGARCTTELKKRVRKEWQRPDDVHVFGMVAEEAGRIDNILDAEPELLLENPLIDMGISKADCFLIYLDAGLRLPTMYQLGYNNNNCVGCLKASGAGYWNKIREDFPEVFAQRAREEELLGVALVAVSARKVEAVAPGTLDRMTADGFKYKMRADGRVRIPLRYLPKGVGSHKDLDIGDCGILCERKEV